MNFKFPSIWLIFAISLIIRLFISFYGTWVGYDEINFYKTGLAFWSDFTIPPRGQVIVYTGAHIPGSLQPVLLGSFTFSQKVSFGLSQHLSHSLILLRHTLSTFCTMNYFQNLTKSHLLHLLL